MAYVKTSDEKNRILKNEKGKLQEQLQAKQKQLGLRGLVPQHGQDEYQQLYDIEHESNHIQEQMIQAREERIKKNEQKRKANQKSFKEKLKMYLMKQERLAREEFDKRRIIFRDGGFSDYEDIIKMIPYRVLLKEIPEDKIKNGIVIPDTHNEKRKTYEVIAIGEGCNDSIKKEDKVVVEDYAGIEIVSKKDKYLIVYDVNIMFKLEE